MPTDTVKTVGTGYVADYCLYDWSTAREPLKDKPRVETITVYKPLFNKDKTVSQFMLQEIIEINYSFSPEIIQSRWIVSEFRPVFERETNSLFRIYKQLHVW